MSPDSTLPSPSLSPDPAPPCLFEITRQSSAWTVTKDAAVMGIHASERSAIAAAQQAAHEVTKAGGTVKITYSAIYAGPR